MAPLRPIRRVLALALAAACWAWGAAARAQTDEIQVYDAEIVDPGHFGLVWHHNYTPQGRAEPGHPGAVVPDRSLNGVPEWAYGLADWAEVGLYLPVYTREGDGRWVTDAAKLRALFVSPRAQERRFFYGLNFELGWNRPWWDTHRFGGEVRPIVGVHLGRLELVLNPIVDTSFDGLGNLTLAPAARVAWRPSAGWALALEHYAELGTLSRLGRDPTEQTLFAVVDWDGPVGIEAGVGRGLTRAGDRTVLKLMLSRAF